MRTLLLLPLATGCIAINATAHEDVLPLEEQIRINFPVDGAAKAAEAPDYAEFYAMTRSVTENVNGMIGFVLGTVWTVVQLPPTWRDTEERTALWGPWSDSGLDPVEVGVWVRAEEDASWTWAVFYLPRGGNLDTDSIPVVTGEVDPGATRDAAAGRFYVDFTTAGAWDPAVNLTGTFGVDYLYDPEGVSAVASFEDYGWNGLGTVDALYAYDEDYEGNGEMDLAWVDDVVATGSGMYELATLRSRWLATGEGRGDAKLTLGDLGTAEVTASECWASDFTRSYYADSYGIQPTEGDATGCAFAEAEYATEASFALSE